jgi:hypothetical protein
VILGTTTKLRENHKLFRNAGSLETCESSEASNEPRMAARLLAGVLVGRIAVLVALLAVLASRFRVLLGFVVVTLVKVMGSLVVVMSSSAVVRGYVMVML